MIHISTAPKGGTVALVTAVDVPVVLTVKGTGQTLDRGNNLRRFQGICRFRPACHYFGHPAKYR